MTALLKDLGPAIIVFDGVDLGPTKGGANFRYMEDFRDVMEDQRGTNAVDKINVGLRCEVEMSLTRMQLAVVRKLVGGYTGTSGTTHLLSSVGKSSYDNAKELILKPQLKTGVAVPTVWLYFPKAFPQVNWEAVFDIENQRVYKTTFFCFVLQEALTGYKVNSPVRIGPA